MDELDGAAPDTGASPASGSDVSATPSTPAADTAPQPGNEGSPAPDASGVPVPDAPAAGTPDNDADSNEFADLYDKVEDEPAAEPVAEPGAFDASKVDPAIAPAFQVSEFIKSPENLIQAARAADEVWQVQTGKADASVMMEGVRKFNPERYTSLMGEVAQYVKWAGDNNLLDLSTFGLSGASADPNAAQVDPAVKALRDEVTAMRSQDQQRQTQEQQRTHLETERKHNEKFSTSLDGLAKGTFLEGDPDVMQRVSNQLEANEVDPAKFRADIAKGDTAALDKAFKQVKNQTLDRIRAYNKNIRDHAQRLRNSTPAAPGQGGLPIGGSKGQNGAAPSRDQFPEGGEGLQQWQEAYARHTGMLK